MKAIRFFIIVFFLVFSLILNVDATEEPVIQDFKTEITGKSRFILPSEVNDMNGDVAISDSEVNLDLDCKIKGELPVTMGLYNKHIDINEDIPVALPTKLVGRKFKMGVKFPAPFIEDDRFFMGVDVMPSYYTDSWDDAPDSAFRIPFRTYLIYKESDDFILVGGVSVRPDYDSVALPVIGLLYRPDEKLTFNFITDDPHVSYKLDDKWTAIFEFDFVYDEYEVSRGTEKGLVLKNQEVSSGFGLQYDVNTDVQALFSVGGVFNRRLEYEDDSGKVVMDDAIYSTVKMTAKF